MKAGFARGVLFLAAASMGLAVSGCQRSPAFKRDQSYYRPESPYYGGQPSPTEKFQAMAQPKKRVVVLDFWNDTPVNVPEIGRFTADELRKVLFMSQRVLISAELQSSLTTEHVVSGDRINVAQLIREGRRLGVAVVVIGRISKITFRQQGGDVGIFSKKQSLTAVDLELKTYDVAGGREIMALAASGEAVSNAVVALEKDNLQSPQFRAEMTRLAVRDAMRQAVPDVIRTVEKLSWKGTVAKIIGNKVYVNAGRASGLVAGDILRVLTQGDDVYDPATGAFLGRAHGQLKGTLEVVDFIGRDGAVAEVHTGANFTEGDVVQLY